MARVDGQCVPKPALVFRQCVEAFRTTRVERGHGDSIAVGGAVPGTGSARVERQRNEVEARELASLPDVDTDAVLEECRRQEQAERARLLDEAWAAADEARAGEQAARRNVRSLESSMAATQRAFEDAIARLEEERARREAQDAEIASLRALAEPEHPCALELWTACSDAAAADHEAGEHARAHRRYAVACEAGQAQACGNWGLMFEHGLGVPVDSSQARALYRQACDADDLHACVRLGVVRWAEDGSVGDTGDELRRACNAEVARGCTTLAQALPATATDDIESLLDAACALDDPRGCRLLGLHLQRFDVDSKGIAASEAFAKACSLGDGTACDTWGKADEALRNPPSPSREVH